MPAAHNKDRGRFMTLFDAYLMVDWSAEARPKLGRDSIWLALVQRTARGLRLAVLENAPTRQGARVRIADLLADLAGQGRRTLVGFDFALGYPAGTAAALGLKGLPWQTTWDRIAAAIDDGADNANNRFAVADRLNAAIGQGAGPFWGHPQGRRFDHLAMTRPAYGLLPERRIGERYISGPQPVWKLSGAGSVGSQALTGIPAVRLLRRDRRLKDLCRVWPFETGLVPLDEAATRRHPVVLAEIYPSLVTPLAKGEVVKDALQVQAIAGFFAHRDDSGALAAMFAGAPDLSHEERAAVEREEGWVLGVDRPGIRAGRQAVDVDALFSSAFAYIDDPQAIYRESRRIIEAEADLSHVPVEAHALAVRLIHTCGMTDLPRDLELSRDAVAKGRAALEAGAPVLTDVEMVAKGIIARRLPAANKVLCKVASKSAAERAANHGGTRSAAGIDLLAAQMGGAVVAIGNAPTALFRVLEIVAAGGPRPALVIGMPVGFVGAAESKRALALSGLDYIAVHGRRGGSAMAAAAVNALMGGI